MATLMQTCAALEDGQARGLEQLSRQVDTLSALVEAILERLITPGKVKRVATQSSGGYGDGCKGCAQCDPCAEPEPYFHLHQMGEAQSPPRQAWRALF